MQKHNNEELEYFQDQMPTNQPLPPIRVEIANLANFVGNINSRVCNTESFLNMINNRLIAIEKNQSAEVEMPQTVKKTKKDIQQQQSAPAWQQKPMESSEPVKKQKPNTVRLILFIIGAVVITFLIGNCQAIISYMQPR